MKRLTGLSRILARRRRLGSVQRRFSHYKPSEMRKAVKLFKAIKRRRRDTIARNRRLQPSPFGG